MKTTLLLPDDLYREVKVAAALSGRSITSVVEESLRRFLAEQGPAGDLPELPVSRNRGGFTHEFTVSGVDFRDTSEVLAWLDSLENDNP